MVAPVTVVWDTKRYEVSTLPDTSAVLERIQRVDPERVIGRYYWKMGFPIKDMRQMIADDLTYAMSQRARADL